MSCYKKGNARPVQKVVIPKGMINPGETTIIEIPSNLQKQPIVVAKRKTSIDSVQHYNPNTKGPGKRKGKGCCQTGGSKTSTQNPHDLEATEKKERDQFLKDLDEFQKARRKLLANASFLAGEKNCGKK